MNLFSFAFGMPGPFEMAIILVIAILLFGSRLPSVARSAGQSIWSFRAGMTEVQNEIAENVDAAGEAGKDLHAATKGASDDLKKAVGQPAK